MPGNKMAYARGARLCRLIPSGAIAGARARSHNLLDPAPVFLLGASNDPLPIDPSQ